jgi:tRNA dimethylallyltransferase
VGGRSVAPRDRSRIVRLLELDDAGRARAARGPNQLWTADTAIPRGSSASSWTATRSTRASTRAWTRWWPPAPRARCAPPTPPGASETARKALGFDELLAGDVEAMKRRTRNFARRQLTWMRKLGRGGGRRRDRPRRGDVAAELVPNGPTGAG